MSQKHSKITRLTSTTIVIHSKDDWKSNIFWCAAAALRGISTMVLCTVCSVFYRAHQDSSWTPPTSQASHMHQPTHNTSSHTTKASESCLSLCVCVPGTDWQNWLLIYLNWLSVPCRQGQLLHEIVKHSFKSEDWVCSDWLLGEWVWSDWLLGEWVCSDWWPREWVCSDWLLWEWVCSDWLLGDECILIGCRGDECVLVVLNKVSFYPCKCCRFSDKSSVEQQRSDWMRGGIQRHRESGYSGRDTDRYTHQHMYICHSCTAEHLLITSSVSLFHTGIILVDIMSCLHNKSDILV